MFTRIHIEFVQELIHEQYSRVCSRTILTNLFTNYTIELVREYLSRIMLCSSSAHLGDEPQNHDYVRLVINQIKLESNFFRAGCWCAYLYNRKRTVSVVENWQMRVVFSRRQILSIFIQLLSIVSKANDCLDISN